MTDSLFADPGPDGRNRGTAAFWGQISARVVDFGWKLIDCDVDLHPGRRWKDPADVDMLVAMVNSQTRREDGRLVEAAPQWALGVTCPSCSAGRSSAFARGVRAGGP